MKAGIPILTFNTTSTPEAQAKCITYVGSDATESGRIQARYVAETVLKGKGNVAYMNGLMGHQAQIDRLKGTEEIFAKYPDIKIVLTGSTDWLLEKGQKLTEDWLNSGTDIDVIMCQSADMAQGAVQALRDEGKTDIKVSAIDITTETVKMLLSGEITNLVFQDAIGQGAGSIKTAMRILNGEKVDKVVDIPYQLVTKDNVKDFEGKY